MGAVHGPFAVVNNHVHAIHIIDIFLSLLHKSVVNSALGRIAQAEARRLTARKMGILITSGFSL